MYEIPTEPHSFLDDVDSPFLRAAPFSANPQSPQIYWNLYDYFSKKLLFVKTNAEINI